MSTKLMFSPGRIGKMRLKNRLVMPPMVRNYADTKGLVTKQYIDHIARIAKGGVGMLILEASYVAQEGKGFVNELGIHSDACIPGLKKLAAVAHKNGAKIGIQLYHAGRQTVPGNNGGKQPVAPSPIPDPLEQVMPRQLKVKEIRSLVRAYARAAGRAKKAGMDFVEIHGAHGYLVEQFLSPFSNKRTDAYGGTEMKRLRFASEVYLAVRKAVGAAYPVTIRLSGDEMVKGGLKIKDAIKIARHLEGLGMDAFHISAGVYGSYVQGHMIPPMAIEDGPLLRLAAAVKKAVNVPVIAVGKLRTPQIVERALKSKTGDFVAIGRTLLADPEWPNKVRAGRLADINKCIACNQGCISRLFAQQDVRCTVNPEVSREALFLVKPGMRKNVLVIGGGPAGLEAAKVAARRGHKVTLYEKSSRLGGQVIAAAMLPLRKDWGSFLETLIHDVKKSGVTIKISTAFSPSMVKPGEYDAAIVALGSTSMRPGVPGINRTNVVIARDLLEGREKATGTVVVAGGGCMGTQVAEALAVKGHKVTVVEATNNIAMEAPLDERYLLLERLKKLHVVIATGTKLVGISDNSVTVEDAKGQRNLQSDTVVLCLGSRPNNGMTDELKNRCAKVFVVGDSNKIGRVTEAVADGALAALQV
jgi:2,4-dienoyl-CoA reductase-like NADH-dependent reductase (Old Yellow Enzyme family)/thioredoxin reductase